MSDGREPVYSGFVLSLSDLDRLVSEISHGDHRWSYSLHTDSSDTEETEVTVAYSNPIYGNLPNAISFHFPIVSSYRLLNRQESTFVCLHPDLAESGDQGRYFEDGDVKRDCLYDCDVFWTPIASTLRRARCREEQA